MTQKNASKLDKKMERKKTIAKKSKEKVAENLRQNLSRRKLKQDQEKNYSSLPINKLWILFFISK